MGFPPSPLATFSATASEEIFQHEGCRVVGGGWKVIMHKHLTMTPRALTRDSLVNMLRCTFLPNDWIKLSVIYCSSTLWVNTPLPVSRYTSTNIPPPTERVNNPDVRIVYRHVYIAKAQTVGKMDKSSVTILLPSRTVKQPFGVGGERSMVSTSITLCLWGCTCTYVYKLIP